MKCISCRREIRFELGWNESPQLRTFHRQVTPKYIPSYLCNQNFLRNWIWWIHFSCHRYLFKKRKEEKIDTFLEGIDWLQSCIKKKNQQRHCLIHHLTREIIYICVGLYLQKQDALDMCQAQVSGCLVLDHLVSRTLHPCTCFIETCCRWFKIFLECNFFTARSCRIFRPGRPQWILYVYPTVEGVKRWNMLVTPAECHGVHGIGSNVPDEYGGSSLAAIFS